MFTEKGDRWLGVKLTYDLIDVNSEIEHIDFIFKVYQDN